MRTLCSGASSGDGARVLGATFGDMIIGARALMANVGDVCVCVGARVMILPLSAWKLCGGLLVGLWFGR